MPRSPRVEFEGAQYHLMCRGDRREPIFKGERDHDLFLETLGQACERTGWHVHAFVLMRNHYHLLVETPAANLVLGMRWFQTTYTARFNARHHLSGHLFQGRYKALVIDPDEPEYARQVADYIHLNPIRARVVATEEDLAKIRWCSYGHYAGSGKAPSWLRTETVMGGLGLDGHRGADRRKFRRYMEGLIEARREDEPTESAGLQAGWVLGGEAFRARIEALVDAVVRPRKRASYDGKSLNRHDLAMAEELLEKGLRGLKNDLETVRALRKNDIRKQALCWLLKSRSVVSNEWIGERLRMGHWSNLSRAFRAIESPATSAVRRMKAKMLKCTD